MNNNCPIGCPLCQAEDDEPKYPEDIVDDEMNDDYYNENKD